MLIAKIGAEWGLVVATVAGALGAVVLQFLLGWARGRSESVVNDQARFREELWKEISEQRGRVERLTEELQESRESHRQLLVEYGVLKQQHESLRNDHAALQERYATLEVEVNELRARPARR